MNQFNTEQFSQFNDQFASATRQFADTAGQVSRLALSNAEQVFGLQLAAIEQNVNATFAFWGELAEARDLDGLKTLWPKGVQVARQNVERAISTGQDVIGRTVKTNEAIGEIAKGQFERATAQAKQAAGNATEQAEAQFTTAASKAAK
jgi:phasin family protein